ncbi:MAG: chromosomal replication initiator protein DnaA [Ruminococcus sp.]|nr:chromosomal replication initiator protein DnaA [Oscillospiraceae bacterium]MBR2723972.1 chromosomal replication initiator protein DnaA [Ruminococcus sp.]
MESFSDAWGVICEYCKTRITDVAYKMWISRIEPIDLDFENSTIKLMVPTEFHKETLERCYTSLINDACREIFGTAFELSLTTPDKKETSPNIENAADPSSIYDYTFANFIVGPSNKFAHAAAQAVAANPAGAYNPLLIYGSSGLGKTHLLYAIGNEIKRNNPNVDIVYAKGDEFTNELIKAIGNVTTAEFKQKYRQADVLLVDDVQFIAGRNQTQEEFFHTFNALYEDHKQIVLISDRPPKDMKILDDRLRSRFESGLIADLQAPDIETRIAIIKKKADILQVPLSDDLADFIAQRIKSNVRQLEGVVKKLKARYLLNNERITQAIVSEAISDILNNDATPEQTLEKIIDEVARTYGVSAEDISSHKTKKANISLPRYVAIYITRELTGMKMVEIGKGFGNMHHSTIVYATQQIEKKIQTDSNLKETIEDIMRNIRDN